MGRSNTFEEPSNKFRLSSSDPQQELFESDYTTTLRGSSNQIVNHEKSDSDSSDKQPDEESKMESAKQP